MFCKETTAVYADIHTKHVNAHTQILYVKTYWYLYNSLSFKELYNILVPSKHNTCKDQMFITTGLYLATCFGR